MTVKAAVAVQAVDVVTLGAALDHLNQQPGIQAAIVIDEAQAAGLTHELSEALAVALEGEA